MRYERYRRPRIENRGITDVSTVDWYGNVSLVVFFAGCNFRCPYCRNSGLIPAGSGEEVELDLLRRRLVVGLNLLDAVFFTGGEPLLQPEAVMEAAELIKWYGLKLMLDTNGSLPNVVEKLQEADLVGRVALDIKAPLTAEDYGRVIGFPQLGAEMAGAVKMTLELCNSHSVEVEARTTVAPTITDEPKFIRRIASNINGRCEVYTSSSLTTQATSSAHASRSSSLQQGDDGAAGRGRPRRRSGERLHKD